MSTPKPRRLVVVASALIDVVLDVPALPPVGGDVLATPVARSPGGAFNVATAAARLALPTVYAGPHGTGDNGDLLRVALEAEGIPFAYPADDAQDTGYCIALVDRSGERTFVTVGGADTAMSAESLAAISLDTTDAVYVSGYDLAYPLSGPVVSAFASSLPRGPLLVLDPGPMLTDVADDVWVTVCRRVDVLSWNTRETQALPRLRELLRPEAVVVRRDGPRGAVLELPGHAAQHLPGHPVTDPVDTNGAGDVHVGAMLSALAGGLEWSDAVDRANLAAAYATTRRGGASGPTLAQLRAFRLRSDPARPV
ncbi:MAG: PfkB family carbohydrate kinase [Actinomycetes bacterium]